MTEISQHVLRMEEFRPPDSPHLSLAKLSATTAASSAEDLSILTAVIESKLNNELKQVSALDYFKESPISSVEETLNVTNTRPTRPNSSMATGTSVTEVDGAEPSTADM